MTTETPHKPDSLKQELSKPSLVSEDALKLCHAIEELPASEQQTKLSISASGLRQRIVEETVQLIPSQENQILELLLRAKGHAVECPCGEVATAISELINRFWPLVAFPASHHSLAQDAEDSAFTSAKAQKDALVGGDTLADYITAVKNEIKKLSAGEMETWGFVSIFFDVLDKCQRNFVAVKPPVDGPRPYPKPKDGIRREQG